MENTYSSDWYRTFLEPIPAQTTATEIGFLKRHLPLKTFPRVLDLCCGPGRHACELALQGYRVLGTDVNHEAILLARQRCPRASFVQCDMRSLDALSDRFDGIVNLWHSFGYFDTATNRDVLRQMKSRLRSGGRVVLDVYNRAHFENRPLEEVVVRAGHQIRTVREREGARFRVRISYDEVRTDEFEWELYTPYELERTCIDVGLTPILQCAWFDESVVPGPEHARMQLVCERAA